MTNAVVGQDERRIEGDEITLRSNRQGGLIAIDQWSQWALEGRTFHTQIGDAQTPVSFAKTAYDEDQPQFVLRVPKQVTVVPLTIEVNFQDQAGTDNHVTVSTATNDIGAGASTATTLTPMRTDAPHQSQCNGQSLYTDTATAATGLIEIARSVDPFAAAQGHGITSFYWNVKEAAAMPVLVGPASLIIHIVGTTTAPAGFLQTVWAEFKTADIVRT